MLSFLKELSTGLGEGIRLSYVAMRYSDPEDLRKAMLVAMGVVLPEEMAAGANRQAETEKERELIAA